MAMIPCPNPLCEASFPDAPKRDRCPVCKHRLSPTGSESFPSLDPEAAGSKSEHKHDKRAARPRGPSRLTPDFKQLLNAYKAEQPIIAVLGFADSGKTFLVNRWRSLLATQWRVMPPAGRGEIPSSPEGLELTLLAAEPSVPHFRDGLSYVIADCAGESFRHGRRASLNGLRGDDLRPYLAALGLASAYVLVIPAPDVHGIADTEISEERLRKLQDTFDRFSEILGAVVVAEERLEEEGEAVETFLKKGISGAELRQASADGAYRSRRPIIVLFSQADRLGNESISEDYDQDPMLQIARAQPAFFNRIRSFFLYYHFDYLTAFEHQHESSTIPDYGCRHFGAVEAFAWLHNWLAYRHDTIGNLIRRLNWGLAPTDWVVGLRKKVDPKFRRALKAGLEVLDADGRGV